jgi:hypothetical protein
MSSRGRQSAARSVTSARGRGGAARGRENAAGLRRSMRINGRNDGELVRDNEDAAHGDSAASEAAPSSEDSHQRDADDGVVNDQESNSSSEDEESEEDDQFVERKYNGPHERGNGNNNSDSQNHREVQQVNSNRPNNSSGSVNRNDAGSSRQGSQQSNGNAYMTINDVGQLIKTTIDAMKSNGMLSMTTATSAIKTHLPPQFDGEPDSKIKVQPWLADLDAHLIGATDAVKIAKFTTFIKGHAKDYFYSLKVSDPQALQSWARLMRAFDTKYHAPIPPSVAYQKLNHRLQAETETVAQFMIAFSEICTHLTPTYNETIRIETFLNNIKPSIRMQMGTAYYKVSSTATLAQVYVDAVAAENLILRNEARLKETTTSSGATNNNNNDASRNNNQDQKRNETNNVNSGSKRFHPYRDRNNGQRRSGGSDEEKSNSGKGNRERKFSSRPKTDKSLNNCWTCNQKGHYAYECPQSALSSSTAMSTESGNSSQEPHVR